MRRSVLHVCRRSYPSTPIQAAIAAAGYAIVPAATLSEVMSQLPLVDVAVISSCWADDEKHRILTTLRQRSSLPILCIYPDAAHRCRCCVEVSASDPVALVAAIERLIGSKVASPSDALHPKHSAWWRAASVRTVRKE